ncbi:MAG: histidinol-phosphate aminotransferase family protein [Deltaproteobacteria bacterium]|jgi:histidinol-phosphate aminotransferase|nr:histidinol-phosphate aminotransferase family protein [Deltaproteobacteria bacterium]MBW2533973.1 histidinol-phosphate aminotransferase family protein [Deltaproteobacteria bacterium]
MPIYLDRNENRYGPPAACVELLHSVPAELLFNYTRAFKKGYYSSLSRRLAEIHDLDEKRVVLGYGCEDILKQAVHHFLRPGERCFVPTASWWYYQAIAEEVEGVTIKYPLVEKGQAYEFDVDALKAAHTEHTARMVLISTPNNPTGNIFPPDRLREILDHFRQSIVVLDEAYWGFIEKPEIDCATLVHEFPNVLVLRTFSKLFGLAGARIGYGLAGAGLGSFLKFSARYLGYSRISERLALAALDDAEYPGMIRRKMVEDRESISKCVRSFEPCQAYDSYANFLLVRFPEPIVAPLKTALDERGLIIKFFSEPGFINYARITLGTQEENAQLVSAFEELLPDLIAKRL